jgi:hypothetical protein
MTDHQPPTADELAAIKARAEAVDGLLTNEVLRLVAEVERLRATYEEDRAYWAEGYDNDQREIERLRATVERVETVHARVLDPTQMATEGPMLGRLKVAGMLDSALTPHSVTTEHSTHDCRCGHLRANHGRYGDHRAVTGCDGPPCAAEVSR